jgi:hypothetical protein
LIQIFTWYDGANDIGSLYAKPENFLKSTKSWTIGNLGLLKNGSFSNFSTKNMICFSNQRTKANSPRVCKKFCPDVDFTRCNGFYYEQYEFDRNAGQDSIELQSKSK